ncbi:acyl-CoA synthetase [Hydrogenophaga sp. IBVHS1]|jgi:predicted LPLAT superfamily acyltransferase|uniref:LpxL/LpxP family acyltransferase n=1 Tax=unclassified Hydrogenophaga TaxID=2610897 RepID=UPI000A2DABB3|nr:acyl-CoA synthetase [Hydrogenophaga sp. IBVHS1]OSZ71168.1 acyl-CoA synthetase [Hydrogenophaga sp. IBVHS1]
MTHGPTPEWMREQERSHLGALRLMVWISLRLGRPVGRLVLRGIALYFVLFSPKARRNGRAYLERALGRTPTWADGYRHVFSFASTVHDRVYLLNDRFDLFDIRIVGGELVSEALQRQPGALLMGAHLGSFEVLRAVGHTHAQAPVAMLMYEENARKINAILHAINPAARHDVVALGHPDSMLKARDRLEAGSLVGMLADRSLANDSTAECLFLGAPARFPVGPWRMAAMLRRPVFFMAGLYLGGNRYELHFQPLADFSTTERGERDAAMTAAMQAYADRLGEFCRRAPYNWFNFFDFWDRS